MKLHPEVLKKNGVNEFVILPYDEFVALQALLADAQDLVDLRAAVAEEKDAPTISLEQLKRVTEPFIGSSKPHRPLTSVVLPEPLGPKIPSERPVSRWRWSTSITGRLP